MSPTIPFPRPAPAIELRLQIPRAGIYRAVAWTDQQWEALPEHDRPGAAIRCPGWGWILMRGDSPD